MFEFLLKIQNEGREFSAVDNAWIDKVVESQTHLLKNIYEGFTEEVAVEGQEVIKRNLFTSKLYTEEPAPRLSLGWILKKGHSKIFFWHGELYRSILTQKIINGAEIFVAEGRALIASWLINGTGNMPARDFFGLMPQRVDVIIRDVLERRFKSVGRGA